MPNRLLHSRLGHDTQAAANISSFYDLQDASI